MAHKKAGGSSKNLKDSNAQYLGTKLYEGEIAKQGSIIVRQRGTVIMPGLNVRAGKDHTLFAIKEGKVSFGTKRKMGFNGKTVKKLTANVI